MNLLHYYFRCCQAGGLCTYYDDYQESYLVETGINSQDYTDAYKSISAGYGKLICQYTVGYRENISFKLSI